MTTTPSIEWINHASYLLRYGELGLICDPWLEGEAFNRGWALLAKSAFTPDRFQGATHVWCSHEHPDHFHVPTLRAIDPAVRANLTFLYQSTQDKLVFKFCQKLNFKEIIELDEHRWLKLDNEVALLCGKHDSGDSWLYVKTPAGGILNTNDCVIDREQDARMVRQRVGDVKVLLTQFSYGNWQGNAAQAHLRKAAALQKLRQIDLQVEVFRPQYVVPFASFIWFNHAENFYMNDEINKVGDVVEHLRAKFTSVTPVVLYPGERWEIGAPHDSAGSVARYRPDYERIRQGPAHGSSAKIDLDALAAAGDKFRGQVLERLQRNPLLGLLRFTRPLRIYLTDHRRSFAFSLRRGLQESTVAYADNDVAISSESLLYAFSSPYGFNTLHVNGRFEIPEHGNFTAFRTYERFGYCINRGITVRQLLGAMLRAFASILTRMRKNVLPRRLETGPAGKIPAPHS